MLAQINWTDAWPIISTIASFASMLICGLAMFIFNGFRAEIQRHSQDIATIKDRLAVCKIECERTTVSKEDYVREVGYSRRRDEMMIEKMARIETKIDVIERIPEITAQIARTVIEQMKRGD